MQDDIIKRMKLMYPDGDIKDESIVFKNAGWGSKEAQELRYAAINILYASMKSQFIKVNASLPRILEIGCGFGLFHYRYGREDNYYGIDINPQAVNYCRDKYSSEKFSVMDMTSHKFQAFMNEFKPDYVIASGVFDHSYIWSMINEERFLHKIIEQTRCAVIATMLYDVTPYKFRNPLHSEHITYTSPMDILRLFSSEIYTQQMFFQFKYDYMDNDYTFALIKPYQLMLDGNYRKWKGVDSI